MTITVRKTNNNNPQGFISRRESKLLRSNGFTLIKADRLEQVQWRSSFDNVKLKGFTLIELMVVISIIAVLSTIGLMSYRVVLQNSRDAKRQADLGVLQSSLEQYHADQFVYPLGSGSCTNGTVGINCPLKDPNGQKTYQSQVSGDQLPAPYPQYVYKPYDSSGNDCLVAANCATYCVYAALENNPAGVTQQLCASHNPDNTKYNFAVSPP